MIQLNKKFFIKIIWIVLLIHYLFILIIKDKSQCFCILFHEFLKLKIYDATSKIITFLYWVLSYFFFYFFFTFLLKYINLYKINIALFFIKVNIFEYKFLIILKFYIKKIFFSTFNNVALKNNNKSLIFNFHFFKKTI